MTEQPTLNPAVKHDAAATSQPLALADVPYDIAWDQIQGCRKYQQDCAVCIPMDPMRHLLVLADGLGGHAAGDIASSVAVTGFCSAFEAPGMPEEPSERLAAALDAANHAIHDRIRAVPELAGMGTTLVAAFVEGRELRWASVGDSPLWLVRGGEMRRLNANHSVAGEMAEQVAAGEITAADADWVLKWEGSVLNSALLGMAIDMVDVPETPVRLEPGDVVIVASDGVETCGPDELIAIVSGGDDPAEELADRILATVEAHGSEYQDNATLIVCRALLDDDKAPSDELSSVHASNG